MLSSDRHHDSIYCNRELEKKHLDLAAEKKAYILDAGDLFDAMQGTYDPRKSYSDLRPEFMVPHYYDAIVDDADGFYSPYAEWMLMMGKGNHEYQVYQKANTDLMSRLVDKLRTKNKNIQIGGMGGFVKFIFNKGGKGGSFSVNYAYHHGGSGGNAPVTRGVIQTNRQGVYQPDANVIHNGHNHQEYILAIKRIRLSTRGKIGYDLQHFVRTPGYKDDHGNNNWSDVKQHSPTPQGCAWMTITADVKNKTYRPLIKIVADVE